ncbi:MAG: RNA polymerase sigma-70 factor [Bacteroidales bacterium]
MQKIAGIDEELLVKRLKAGDQTAFELLFKHYYPGLLVFATQITLDKEEAIEIVQDFFVNFWTKHATLKNEKSIKSYLFTSIKNRSINFLKKQKYNERIIQDMTYLSENSPLYEPDIFVESELQQKIKDAIDKLPKRCGEIFVMSRIEGLSNDEIANKLSISKRTVETHISKALKVLRIELKMYIGLLLLLEMMK